jgi:NAD-dependent dihydropyrimidine dehydrogenase PreA subunit
MKECPRCKGRGSDTQRFCSRCNTELFFPERLKGQKQSILTLYFSGTGNTEYIANLFSREMNAFCLSIESDTDFTSKIKAHDTITFCYPVYGSRVPRIMREFVAKHMSDLSGKKLVIFVTQLLFSGDGARVFTDMFWEETVTVIYAEHFNMPNNICNTPILRPASARKIRKYKKKAEAKMARVCNNIKRGVIKKRGFSRFSEWLGKIQGKPWQGNSREINSSYGIELKAKNAVKIHRHCNACNLCVKICPMKNLANKYGQVEQQSNCIVCYRCVNRCPQRAITVLWHRLPKWQYKGLGD